MGDLNEAINNLKRKEGGGDNNPEAKRQKIDDGLEEKTIPLKKITDIVECLICLEVVQIPFKVCKRGHLMCTSCMKNLDKCPLCQEESFWDNFFKTIKKLVELVPRSCKYTGNGCTTLVQPDDHHESFCAFRPLLCNEKSHLWFWHWSCNAKVAANGLLQHYRTAHSSNLIETQKGSIAWKYAGIKNGIEEIPIVAFGRFFFLKRACVVQMVPIGEAKEDYFVTMELKKEDQVRSCAVKPYTLGPGGVKGTSMIIVRRPDLEFVDTDGNLELHFEFCKTQ